MASETFLSEFPPVSTERWEHMIREKMSGTEYASKLIWHPEEGLAVKPYYRAEDLAGLKFIDAAPGEFPYARGTRSTGGWRIREEIDLVDPEDANRSARAAFAAGAEEIAFRHTKLETAGDVATVLAGLHEVPLMFVGAEQGLVRLVMERLRKRPHGSEIATDLDPLADLDFSTDLLRDTPEGFRPFVIHAEDLQEHAAGTIEEVGFAISAGVDFIAEMRDRGLGVSPIVASMSFSFAMGPELFVQVAKLRAFRLGWAKVVESFGGAGGAMKAVIHARTARWNTTIYDPEINILRATTEAISAVLGGADSISISPFDELSRCADDSSRRLARNAQIVLKQEAQLSRVADPLGGSYLIESLTNSIASKAWKLFQELEAAGGYQKASAAGVIASVLDRRMSSRGEAVASRRRVLTGTNRFANASEQALNRIDTVHVDSVKRAAESFEQLRLRTEQFIKQTGIQPRIVLVEMGDLKMRNARAQFAMDFLACAGLVSDQCVLESAARVADLDAEVIVLCSSDAEYLSIAEQIMPVLKTHGSSAKVIVAGKPETWEQLRDLGAVDFVHLRSNALEVLTRIQQIIGIKV